MPAPQVFGPERASQKRDAYVPTVASMIEAGLIVLHDGTVLETTWDYPVGDW